MSQRKHKKALFNGLIPQFPESISRLNLVCEKSRPLCGSILDKIFKLGKRVFKRVEIATSDRYLWFWGMKIDFIPTGSVIIAFPYCQDWNKKNSTQADRSIAFYAEDNIDKDYIDNLSLEIIELFKKYNFEKRG